MTDNPLQFSLRRFFVRIAVISVVLATARFFYTEYLRLVEAYSAFGAVWQTQDMLIVYMHQNDGEWPPNWDALGSILNTNQGYSAPSVDWLKRRVRVDFTFDPASLQDGNLSNTPLAVLTLPDGRSNGETEAANERIVRYIANVRRGKPAADKSRIVR